MKLEEIYELGNLFFEDVNSNQMSNVEWCHLDSSDLVKIIGGSCPHATHDQIQFSKCNSTILENFETHQEF